MFNVAEIFGHLKNDLIIFLVNNRLFLKHVFLPSAHMVASNGFELSENGRANLTGTRSPSISSARIYRDAGRKLFRIKRDNI